MKRLATRQQRTEAGRAVRERVPLKAHANTGVGREVGGHGRRRCPLGAFRELLDHQDRYSNDFSTAQVHREHL
jgi:hypothetical protein